MELDYLKGIHAPTTKHLMCHVLCTKPYLRAELFARLVGPERPPVAVPAPKLGAAVGHELVALLDHFGTHFVFFFQLLSQLRSFLLRLWYVLVFELVFSVVLRICFLVFVCVFSV